MGDLQAGGSDLGEGVTISTLGGRMVRIGAWGYFVFREEEEDAEESEGERAKGREAAMRATLSASSSRPWAFVGSGVEWVVGEAVRVCCA